LSNPVVAPAFKDFDPGIQGVNRGQEFVYPIFRITHATSRSSRLGRIRVFRSSVQLMVAAPSFVSMFVPPVFRIIEIVYDFVDYFAALVLVFVHFLGPFILM